MSKELMIPPGVKLTPTSLTVSRKLTFDEYQELITTLKTVEGGVQFWIGDALNDGEATHGEKYAQAVDEAQAKTWKDYSYVARNVDKSIRIDLLGWAHHQIIASLPPKGQKYWLNEATERDLSVRDLRKEIKKTSTPELPDGKYRVVYADPPWKYSDDLIDGYGAIGRL